MKMLSATARFQGRCCGVRLKLPRVHVTEIQPSEVAGVDETVLKAGGLRAINDVCALGHSHSLIQ